MENNNYKPVSCSLYDGVESLIVKRKNVNLKFLNEENIQLEAVGIITDLFSKDKAEFIKVDSGIIIRLDKLLEIDGIKYSAKC